MVSIWRKKLYNRHTFYNISDGQINETGVELRAESNLPLNLNNTGARKEPEVAEALGAERRAKYINSMRDKAFTGRIDDLHGPAYHGWPEVLLFINA